MSATAEVFLSGRSTPFLAEETEVTGAGWLRALGRWPRWDVDDDSDRVVVRYSDCREYHWPPHRIKEVRRA